MDEHSGDVFAGEGVRGIRDEETCLACRDWLVRGRDGLSRRRGGLEWNHLSDSTVTGHHALQTTTLAGSTVMGPEPGATRCARRGPGRAGAQVARVGAYLERLHAGLGHFVDVCVCVFLKPFVLRSRLVLRGREGRQGKAGCDCCLSSVARWFCGGEKACDGGPPSSGNLAPSGPGQEKTPPEPSMDLRPATVQRARKTGVEKNWGVFRRSAASCLC